MTKSRWILVLVFLGLASVRKVNSYNILMVYPSYSESHVIVASGLLKGLTKFGHEVTMVSSFPQKNPVKNYRAIIVPYEINKDAVVTKQMQSAGNLWTFYSEMHNKFNYAFELSNRTMSVPEFRKIMDEETFDIVLIGFIGQFLVGLRFSPLATFQIINSPFGNPSSIAYSSYFLLGYHGQMTFMQRVKNFMMLGVDILIQIYSKEFYERPYYESNFPRDKFPEFDEALKKASLALINSHFSQTSPRANVPAVVDVGGVHIEDEGEPLSPNVQEFLDSATEGAILFTFGSNIKTSFLPEEKIRIILDTFGTFRQKVLFKWEESDLPGKPDNVLISKWMPQRNILAHRNIKLFVTHGGLGSVAEAKYFGVPIVGVPFFNDQMANVMKAADEGWAYYLDFTNLTIETFTEALKEVLNNPKYRETVQKMAQIFKDRPQTALETANFWIEYVIRHNGAPHLQSQSVHLNILQRNSLDVIAFLIGMCFLVFKLTLIIVKFVWRKLSEKFITRKKKQM
ncbi:hypothetical protein DMENIID0001_056070 [Sergentomyia squamirostris]